MSEENEEELPLLLRIPTDLVHWLAGSLRDLVEELNEWVGESAEDPAFRRAFEADLGLPFGALSSPQSAQLSLAKLDNFLDAEEADLEEFFEAVDDIHKYIDAWRAVLEAAAQEDTGLVVDELIYRLFELGTLNRLKYHAPWVYWFARLAGFITQELRIHVVETVRTDNLLAAIKDPTDYFKNVYRDLRLQKPERSDPCPSEEAPDTPQEPPSAEELTRIAHLHAYTTLYSDLILGLASIAPVFLHKHLGTLKGYYAWEPSPETETPIADLISERALTLAYTLQPEPDGPQFRAILTSLLLPGKIASRDEKPGLGGLFLSLRGDVTTELTAGDALDPWKIKARFIAPEGISILFGEEIETVGPPTAAMEVSVSRAPAAKPAAVLRLFGAGLEFGQVSFKLEITPDVSRIKVKFANSALVIAASDADSFLARLLSSDELRLKFDLGLTLDTQRGLYLEGGAGLNATLPIGKAIGPVTVQTLQINVNPGSGPNSSDIDVKLLTSLSVKLGSVTITAERLGLKFGLGFSRADDDRPDGTTTLLPAVYIHDDIGFERPTGLGILVEASCVTGGGFLFYDSEQGQYAGVVQLQFEKFMFKAMGILTPAPPDSLIPFSLIIVFSFEFAKPITFGPCIKWTAIGGLVGLNRTADVEALRSGLKNRALDPVLFPENPVAEAPRLLASLRTLFPPAEDQFMLGLVLKFEWPTPTLLTAELGLIVEFPSPVRVIVVGQFRAQLPRPDLAQVKINIDAVGIYDFDRSELSIDATLFDSSILSHSLTGDGALRLGGDEAILSVGGFHPHYKPPPGLPRLERLAVHFNEGDNLRLRAEAYVAITSNSLQFGAHLEAYVGFGGFSIEGNLGFDALFQSEYPEFVALVHCGIALKWHGHTLLGAQLDMTVSGYKPLHLEGKVTFEILGFDKSKSFNKTFFKDEPPAALPLVDPLPDLVAALRDGRNWSAQLPEEISTLVTQRIKAVPDVVAIHPLGEIAVRQRVAPLNLELARFGQARLAGDQRFAITHLTLNGQALEPDPVLDKFAAGQFLDLDDHERLSRPSLEPLEAGVKISPAGLRYGGQTDEEAAWMAAAEVEYETCILGERGECVQEEKPHKPNLESVLRAVEVGPAARAPLRASGPRKYQTSSPEIRVQAPAYAIASVDSLAQVDGEDESSRGPARYASYTAAEQALQGRARQGPAGADRLQVVWKFELAKETL
jgi:hypothetical protein